MWKILILVATCIFATSFSKPPNKEVNVWHKVSEDPLDPGAIVALDMTKGYAFSDPMYIYIVVQLVGEDNDMVIAFPNGGYCSAPGIDTISIEIQKHFGKLEQDLKNK